jgi:hypothetical protein
LVTVGSLAGPVAASDPVGVYGLVEKVVLEPASGDAQRIQVWGVFALTDGRSGDGYRPAERGYLYYSLKPGKEDICKKEWADLKSLAGTDQGIGFGARYTQNGRVRKLAEKPEGPDVYPTGIGVMKMGSEHNQVGIMAELRKLKRGE